MSNISLLVDCHKIISKAREIKIGSRTERSYGRTGITTSRLPRKN
jgi:hypothetical protein